MDKLKPCPKCKGNRLFEDSAFYFPLYGYAIGCLNIDCENEMVICYGFRIQDARSRAIRAWNKRADNETIER